MSKRQLFLAATVLLVRFPYYLPPCGQQCASRLDAVFWHARRHIRQDANILEPVMKSSFAISQDAKYMRLDDGESLVVASSVEQFAVE